jgi:acetyltransferase-like isoleucine patch superfamily enzyme
MIAGLRLLFRMFRLPVSAFIVAVDRWWWPLWLKAQGVQYGAGLKLVGRPEIRMMPGGEIRLGDHVRLGSRPASNAWQLASPCALSLRRPNARIIIGSHTALSGTAILSAVSVEIGDHVLVGPNCKITDTDSHPLAAAQRRVDRNAGASSRPVVIGSDVFIGAQSIILKGTVLGDGCVVGAGSVVSGEFPPRVMIAGNPAKVVKTLGDSAGAQRDVSPLDEQRR